MNHEVEVVNRDNAQLVVRTAPNGKFITYVATLDPGTTDCFNVGISHESIKQLKELAVRRTFRWVIRDKSLEIEAIGRTWRLHFRAADPPDLRATLELSEFETNEFMTSLLHTQERDHFRQASLSLSNQFEPGNDEPVVPPGRNDPCSCGSGRKYKQCCLPHRATSSVSEQLSFAGETNDPEVVALVALARKHPGALHDWEYWGALGRSLGQSGRHDLALRAFLKSKEIAPSGSETSLDIAVTLDHLNRADEALELVNSIPDGCARKAVVKANILRGSGATSEAIALYELAIREEPDFPLPYLNLIGLLEMDSSPLVEFWYEEAIRCVPASPDLARMYCRFLQRTGRLQELADAHWIDKLESERGRYDIIGRHMHHDEIIAEAQAFRAMSRAALTGDPDALLCAMSTLDNFDANWHVCDLAQCLVAVCSNLGEPDLVEIAYARVCDGCRKSSSLFATPITTYVSTACKLCGDYERGIQNAEKSLIVRPDDLRALADLFWCLDEIGSDAAAIDAARRLYEADPSFAHIRYNLAFLYGKSGMLGLAEHLYCEELSANGANVIARENLAYTLLLNGKIDEACEIWKGLELVVASLDQIDSAEYREYCLEFAMRDEATASKREAWVLLVELARACFGRPSYTLDLIAGNGGASREIGAVSKIVAREFSIVDIIAALARPTSNEAIELARHMQAIQRGDLSAYVAKFRELLPLWEALPQEAQASLIEGERRFVESAGIDSALEVVAYAKALEIFLRRHVFDAYARMLQADCRFGDLIAEASGDSFKQVQGLIRFLSKGTHLELGSMVHLLKMLQGGTAAKLRVLGGLCAFIVSELGWSALLQREVLEDMDALSRLRNAAAHSERLTRQDSAVARRLALGVLGLLTPGQ